MRYVNRALREVYSALTAAGWMWLGISTMGPPPLPGTTRKLAEPPRSHPERVRPDIPLTSIELALQRQLVAPIGDRE
jgi:hypothetical protein